MTQQDDLIVNYTDKFTGEFPKLPISQQVVYLHRYDLPDGANIGCVVKVNQRDFAIVAMPVDDFDTRFLAIAVVDKRDDIRFAAMQEFENTIMEALGIGDIRARRVEIILEAGQFPVINIVAMPQAKKIVDLSNLSKLINIMSEGDQ